jgi:hypothetical protein
MPQESTKQASSGPLFQKKECNNIFTWHLAKLKLMTDILLIFPFQKSYGSMIRALTLTKVLGFKPGLSETENDISHYVYIVNFWLSG